ncbi:MAG: glycosyltransferase family 2 protein [Candidatus Neomarinimicrobiota bacterium]
MNIKNFQRSYDDSSVIEYANNVPNNPTISVCIQAYQHELYIEECIQSVLSQKINFKIEILIGEDQSTDKTREICISYAKRYPNIIKLFLHDRSNSIKINNIDTGRFNLLYNLASANGKYIAICDGDDYWSDNSKLKKQLQICQQNENGVVVSDYYYQYGKELVEPNKLAYSQDYDYVKLSAHKIPEDIYHFSHTSALFFDKKLLKKIFSEYWTYKAWGLDTILVPLFFKYGTIYFINEKIVIYRIRKEGQSTIKEEGSGNIHKYKYNQFKSLKIKFPNFKKNIQYEQNIAIIKYFTRSLDSSILDLYLASIAFMLSKGNYSFIKNEITKFLRNIKDKSRQPFK